MILYQRARRAGAHPFLRFEVGVFLIHHVNTTTMRALHPIVLEPRRVIRSPIGDREQKNFLLCHRTFHCHLRHPRILEPRMQAHKRSAPDEDFGTQRHIPR